MMLTVEANGRPVIDFDHYDGKLLSVAPELYRRLRAEAPVAWSPHYGGFWLISRYSDVMVRMDTPDAFSSDKTYDADGNPHGGVTIPSLHFWLVPTEADKPDWLRFRTALAPFFLPRALDQLRAITQQYCDELLDRVIESGRCDLVKDFVLPLPSLVTMHMLGLPVEEWQRFTIPLHQGSWAPPGSREALEARQGLEWFFGYLQEQIAHQRTNPRPGMISHLISCKAMGESKIGSGDKLSEREIFSLVVQVATGGVDTTTALTSNSVLYLGQHPDERRRLIEHPSLLAPACEEFMRYFSPLQNLAQTALRDMELGGQQIKAGDRLMLLYASANRDETVFEDAESIKLDRSPNRHLGFGVGMHRCIGSSLAKLMFNAMITTLLERVPDFTTHSAQSRPYPTLATVNGWSSVPATFTPGKKRARRQSLPAWKDTIDFSTSADSTGLSMAALLAHPD
jgi:cytochrome P450